MCVLQPVSVEAQRRSAPRCRFWLKQDVFKQMQHHDNKTIFKNLAALACGEDSNLQPTIYIHNRPTEPPWAIAA